MSRDLSEEDVPAFKLGKELVSIATNIDFGYVRSDMIESLLQKSAFGDPKIPTVLRLGIITKALSYVLLSTSVLADAIAEDTATIDALTDAIAEGTATIDALEAQLSASVMSDRPKPLRRLRAADDQLRDLDG